MNEIRLSPEDWVADPVCWLSLDEAEREIQLATLERWLRWLLKRYCLDGRVAPECWREHGALVEELSALRISWVKATVHVVSDGSYTQLQWHSDFAFSRERLAEWVAISGCRSSEHRPPPASAI